MEAFLHKIHFCYRNTKVVSLDNFSLYDPRHQPIPWCLSAGGSSPRDSIASHSAHWCGVQRSWPLPPLAGRGLAERRLWEVSSLSFPHYVTEDLIFLGPTVWFIASHLEIYTFCTDLKLNIQNYRSTNFVSYILPLYSGNLGEQLHTYVPPPMSQKTKQTRSKRWGLGSQHCTWCHRPMFIVQAWVLCEERDRHHGHVCRLLLVLSPLHWSTSQWQVSHHVDPV